MSLITRYRPSTLDKVIGQKVAITSIKKMLDRKNPPHTWLLIGPSGTGKTTLARIIASHFAGGSIITSNVIDHDCAVYNSAEAIRELTIKAQYKAIGSSPVKAIVLDECQNLSSKGFDALLKSLEEPPGHVFWFLCSTNPGKIPETLKTRAVKISLRSVDESELFELLTEVSELEKFDTPSEILEFIAENSNKSPRQALSNLELCAHSKSISEARELLRKGHEEKNVVELAKFLLSPRSKQWKDAMNIVNSLEKMEPESIRIVTINYLAGALIKAKSNDEAARILYIMEQFSNPYNDTDKLAPLLMNIGSAMGIGQ